MAGGSEAGSDGTGIRRLYSSAAPHVRLWLADLDRVPAQPHDLAEDEVQRAARFVFERDRRRYTAAHAVLRRVLAGETGEPPLQLRLAADAHGKPRLLDHPRLHFNLSHSAQWALIGVAGTGIGVDIEALHEVRDLDDLARRHYTPDECAELAAVEAPQRQALFLTCWTRKEACLKAIGLGLSVEPRSFEAGARAGSREVQVAAGAGVAPLRLHLVPLALPVAAVGSLALLADGGAG